MPEPRKSKPSGAEAGRQFIDEIIAANPDVSDKLFAEFIFQAVDRLHEQLAEAGLPIEKIFRERLVFFRTARDRLRAVTAGASRKAGSA